MSDVMAPIRARLAARPRWVATLYAGNARAVIGRGFKVIRNANWGVIATGFFEPVFYLLAMGVGMGALVGTVPGPDGAPISYAMYIAPALLATSAMNGAIYDSVNNVFFKLRYSKVYEGMLQTSLGPMDVAIGELERRKLKWAWVRGEGDARLQSAFDAIKAAGLG